MTIHDIRESHVIHISIRYTSDQEKELTMHTYTLTRDSITLLLLLVGFMAMHVIAYALSGRIQQIVFICMTVGSLVGMYAYIRERKYWHMLICGVIGMVTVFAGLDSIGPIL